MGLVEKRRALRLLAFPRGRSTARFFGGERMRSQETDAGWRLAIRGKTRRLYRLQASLAALKHRFRPCRIELDGRELAPRRWSYDRSTRVLNVKFGGRTPTLEVGDRGCG